METQRKVKGKYRVNTHKKPHFHVNGVFMGVTMLYTASLENFFPMRIMNAPKVKRARINPGPFRTVKNSAMRKNIPRLCHVLVILLLQRALISSEKRTSVKTLTNTKPNIYVASQRNPRGIPIIVIKQRIMMTGIAAI